MAIDEAILTSRMRNLAPNTIRFYRWNPSAVSIGKFQTVEKEVQLENCKKYGVDVVRRITGGGTVYHDAYGEITYSIIASKEDLEAKDITAVYAKIYAGLAEALKILGLTTDFNEGNAKTCPNLTVNGKKISGSAQSHKGAIVLQHGTLLLDVDLEKMYTFLQIPSTRTCMEIVDVAKNKITSIRSELEKDISEAEVHQALIKGFQKTLNTQFANDELTYDEVKLVEKLSKEKYSTDDWNLKGITQLS
jgi:lipoate-protein ligase A